MIPSLSARARQPASRASTDVLKTDRHGHETAKQPFSSARRATTQWPRDGYNSRDTCGAPCHKRRTLNSPALREIDADEVKHGCTGISSDLYWLLLAHGVVTPSWACGPTPGRMTERMKKISYSGYRFAPEIIHQAIWLHLRFTLSLRDVEDLLAERGVAVSYETVRRWVNHFGPMIAADLRKRRLKPHTTWHLDEGVPRKHQQQWGCGAA